MRGDSSPRLSETQVQQKDDVSDNADASLSQREQTVGGATSIGSTHRAFMQSGQRLKGGLLAKVYSKRPELNFQKTFKKEFMYQNLMTSFGFNAEKSA